MNHVFQELVEKYKPKIIDKREFRVVGISCNTTMMDKDIKVPNVVEEFHSSRIGEVKNRMDETISYGIFVDPPNFNPEKDEFTWIAGVEVTNDEDIPLDMMSITISAHQYAVLAFNPKTDDINPYQFLYQWFTREGYEEADLIGFEVYNPYKGVDSDYILHLPVKKIRRIIK
ncbi:AraC family transcriptional regulator [Bacillus timonensis]|uniref:AraC family transcriptional regulator n=1 Tax=Bacillus timonensis TaxID=1033734 RepID=A0A4S3PVL8_9BACI|nr:GyrI-like domain-containing protein [Bacillus timonensis]THE13574.1 AraC family transcriptional regulator [Bacillus timonensis]